MTKYWVLKHPNGAWEVFTSDDEVKEFLTGLVRDEQYKEWKAMMAAAGRVLEHEKAYVNLYLKDHLFSLEKKAFVSVKEEADRFKVSYSNKDLEQIGLMVLRAYKYSLGDRAVDVFREERVGDKLYEVRLYLKEKREEIDKTIVRFYRRKHERLRNRDMSEATEKSLKEHDEMVALCEENIRRVKLTINPKYPKHKLFVTRGRNGKRKNHKVQLEGNTRDHLPRRRRRSSTGHEKI
jgi:hypothetical protein